MLKKNKLSNLLSAKTSLSKIFLITIFLVSTSLFLLPLFFRIDIESFLAFGMIGLFLINFLGSATLFLPAPAIVSVALAGASFNPLLVAIVAGLSSSLGEGVAYIFGYSSTEILDLRKHKKLFKFSQIIVQWRGGILIPVFACIPNPFFDGLGILAGISEYPLKRFILLTFIGRTLRNIGIAYLGLFLW